MLHPELIFAILSIPMFSFVCIMAFKQKVLLDTKRNVSMRVLIKTTKISNAVAKKSYFHLLFIMYGQSQRVS